MAERVQKVRDLMTGEVIRIGMDATLQKAQRVFNERRFHHLIVVEDDKPVGVISDRDLLKNLSPFIGVPFTERPQDVGTLKKKIHQMMTRKLISIDPEAPLGQAARMMNHHQVSCLPVIEADGRLVGIITSRDLVRWVVTESLRQPAGG
jgi:acetoin utilization protein AcuB